MKCKMTIEKTYLSCYLKYALSNIIKDPIYVFKMRLEFIIISSVSSKHWKNYNKNKMNKNYDFLIFALNLKPLKVS